MTNQKILFLGHEDSPLLQWLREQGEEVFQTFDKVTPAFLDQENFDVLISYNYLHILRKNVLERFPNRAVNLHISFLPWNRGKDPNFWSFVDCTPKGITIHHVDEGVDTGDIIAQKEVLFHGKNETLATSYQTLHTEIIELFKQNWDTIKDGTAPRTTQTGPGSEHKGIHKEPLLHLLTNDWDTPVANLIQFANETKIADQFWKQYRFDHAEQR